MELDVLIFETVGWHSPYDSSIGEEKDSHDVNMDDVMPVTHVADGIAWAPDS